MNQPTITNIAQTSGPGDTRLTTVVSVDSLVFTAEQLAQALGVSRAHAFRLHSRGLLPRPFRLGRTLRWDRATIDRWLAAGAPPRDRWEQMSQENRRRS